MTFRPVQVFGFIMSFAYVFFGLLFITTTFADTLVSDMQYRKILGGTVVAYGLFRVAYFLRKIRAKS
jgi:cytochrome c biogenesis protein CcdA